MRVRNQRTDERIWKSSARAEELEEQFLQDGEGGELQDVDDRVNDVELEERAAHLDR